ncbi:MAG: heme exporter protein CcmD [Sphingomonadales bacterium]
MDAVAALFDLGKYSSFIWPAFGLAAVVMATIAVTSYRALRSAERRLADIERESRGRTGDGA